MAMIGLEKRFMGSLFKRLMQHYFEFWFFKRFSRPYRRILEHKVIMEVGCGFGFGLKLISKAFQPLELVGIDLDPALIQQAQMRCPEARVYVGDVTNLSEPPNHFDAVFAFTVFHHVSDWKKGLQEVHRILKPHGLCLVNDLNKGTLDWLERALKIAHPPEARFSWDEFLACLEDAGFKILQQFQVIQAMGFSFCEKI